MEIPRTCFIGGETYDPLRVEQYVEQLAPGHLVVTGDARGAEERVKTIARERGQPLRVPPLQLSIVDRTKALKLQVIDIYVQALHGGKLVLVGKGERVEEARSMLARSAAWPMEVEEL